ncbi:hypothetical protein KVP09_01455 [Alcaligenaceae bacterium CGII-47]|nr:hypothetical protein [Alcaligenaceae bacterium CGII-47]
MMYLISRARSEQIILRVDAWRFAAVRAQYYDYLQAVLRGMHGHRTIGELFDLDAYRYGLRSTRGRLSAHWSRLCLASGGDLYSTWRTSFPLDELVLVRAAQAFGNARLLACFEALSRHLSLMAQASRILWATLGVAVCALLIACLSLLVLPVFTVPGLMRAFQGLPQAYYGPMARHLFTLSHWVAMSWPVLVALVLLTVFFLFWSLPNTCGRLRQSLDGHGLWRLYRHVQALRMLALLGILLDAGASASTQLRPALLLLEEGASAWVRRHVQDMLARIDAGLVGAVTFDTGLLDRELYWYLQDMAQARGLQAGLTATCERLQGQLLGRIAQQAVGLRWLVMLASVACVLGVGLWHYAAMDELRRALMMFHASQ